MTAIRLLDLGLVSPARSQTVYHAVAYAMTPESQATIILVSPSAPYVCIGYHQDAAREVDLDYCAAHGLPVLRREVGGGAVYLDDGQVFTQWIFPREQLPAPLEQRFALYVQPLVATYQALGIDARYRPINDIHVAGKKIGGTGAASLGEAEVMVGSLMFDFNFALMARVLRVPSQKMRDKVYQSLQEYMTTMTRELRHRPERSAVLNSYAEHCRAALGVDLVPGELTPPEEALAAELDERFVSAEWLYQKGGLRQRGVKIHEDVRVVESAHKVPGGLIRVTARLRHGRIDDLTISGDFTLLPTFGVAALEQALRGLTTRREILAARVQEVYRALGIQSPGVTPDDFTAAILAMTG